MLLLSPSDRLACVFCLFEFLHGGVSIPRMLFSNHESGSFVVHNCRLEEYVVTAGNFSGYTLSKHYESTSSTLSYNSNNHYFFAKSCVTTEYSSHGTFSVQYVLLMLLVGLGGRCWPWSMEIVRHWYGRSVMQWKGGEWERCSERMVRVSHSGHV